MSFLTIREMRCTRAVREIAVLDRWVNQGHILYPPVPGLPRRRHHYFPFPAFLAAHDAFILADMAAFCAGLIVLLPVFGPFCLAHLAR